MKTFVIVGCGRLAGVIAEAVVKGLLPEYDLIGVYSRTAAKAERIAGQMRNAGRACAVCESVEKLLALKPDILVETASPAALREWAVPTLKNGTSIVTLSIGALADDAFYREVSAVAKENGTRIYQQAAAYTLMLNTGLRTGEALGLLNSDIDLENRVIHLQRGVKEVSRREGTESTSGREVKIGKLKSTSSKRDVPLKQAAWMLFWI